MKLFGFSGLGADERVFDLLNTKLNIPITPIPWIKPFEDESIQEYASRLSEQITQTKEDIILVGISFGGIIATEVAKKTEIQRIILISSASTLDDIPWHFKLLGLGKVFKKIPEKFLLPPPFIANWFFSVKTPEHKKLLKEIIESTDTNFARWAITKLSTWQNREEPDNVIRIHGTNDRVLPLTKRASYKITKGGHFIVVEKANEIADIINHIVEEAKR